MMPIENIQEFRSNGAWNVSFCAQFACWFTSGQSGWTRGLQTKRSFSMMQDFRQSSETIGTSPVSKMLRQLTGQISAHHSSSKIITSHLRLFRPDQGPHTVLKYIYFQSFFCIKSNKRSSKSLLEKLHCLYLGELVDASRPGQTLQAACPGFHVPSLAEST